MKEFEVVLITDLDEEVLAKGDRLDDLMHAYMTAIRQAKKDKKNDDKTRWVLLREVLLRTKVLYP